MNKHIKLFAGLAFSMVALISSTTSASAATYYVAKTGSDAYTTTQAQNPATPWLTLQHAETAAADGDTVYAAAGTYVEDSGLNRGWWVTKAIHWIAQGQVIVRGTATCSTVLQVYGTTNTVVDGFTIDAEGTRANNMSFSSSAANNVLTNMVFQGATTSVVSNLRGVSNTISYSTFTVGTGVIVLSSSPAAGNSSTLDHNTFNLSNSSYLLRTVSGGGTVTLSNNVITGYSSVAVISLGQNGTYNFTNNNFTINNAVPDVLLTTAGTGTVNFTGNTVNMSVKTSNPVIYFSAGTWTLDINGNNITNTDNTQLQNIINLKNQYSPKIQNNTIESHSTTMNSDISILSTGTDGGTLEVKNNIIRSRGGDFIIAVGTDLPDSGSTKLNGGLIEGNTIYGNLYYDPSDMSNDVHAIYYSQNVNATIRYNKIIGVGMGIVVKGTGESYSSGGIYYNEIINGNTVAAIRIKGVKNVPVYNNSIWADSAFTARLVLITEYNEGQTATGATLKNNILACANCNAIEINEGSQTGFTSNHNLIFRGTGTTVGVIGATTYSDLASWRAAGFDAQSVSADPFYLDTANLNLRLQRTSTAIDAGESLGFSRDKANISVPQGSAADIGAYEYIPLTVTINKAGGQADPTKNSPVNYTVVFSESVTGFTASDVQLSGTANPSSVAVTGSGTTYNVAVSGMSGSGTVIASIPAGAASGVTGNSNSSSTSSDNSVLYDITAPVTSSNIDTEWHNTNVTVSLTCSDEGVAVCSNTYYTTDGSEPTVSSQQGTSFVISTEGTNTIKYFSVDSLGNIEAIKTAYVLIDKTAPTIKITRIGLISNVPDKDYLSYYYTSQTPYIQGITEAGKTTIHFIYKTNNYTSTADASGNFQISVSNPSLPRGWVPLTYYAVDRAGNKSAERQLILIIGDNNFPNITSTVSPSTTPAITSLPHTGDITVTPTPIMPSFVIYKIEDLDGKAIANAVVTIAGQKYTSDLSGNIKVEGTVTSNMSISIEINGKSATGRILGQTLVIRSTTNLNTIQDNGINIAIIITITICVVIVGVIYYKKSKLKY